MATLTHGKLAYLGVDFGAGEQDLSDVLKQAAVNRDRDIAEATPFGADAKTKKGGITGGKIPFDGWFDATIAALMDGVLDSDVDLTFSYGPAGHGTGDYKYSGSCILAKWNVESSSTDMVKASGEFAIDGVVSTGTFS